MFHKANHRLHPNIIFKVCNFLGSTCPTRLGAALSHLRKLTFRHKFWDLLNPVSDCDNSDSTKYYLFHYYNFKHERQLQKGCAVQLIITL